MKRNVSVVGIVLISVMLFAGCSGNPGIEENLEPKSITITNIDRLSGAVSVWVSKEGSPRTGVVARGDGVIENGSVTVQLKETDASSNSTGNDWTGNGQYYIVVGKKDIVPDFATAAKVDINGAGTTIGAADFKSFASDGVLGGNNGEDPGKPGAAFKVAIPAGLLFGSFTGEKTIDELLRQLGGEDLSLVSYNLFSSIIGGAIYLDPAQTAEVTGSTKISADIPLYITIAEAPLPVNLLFGSFAGEKTIDELLQRLVEEEVAFSIPLNYELFKTLGGAIYLGPGRTREVTGSTRIRAADSLYITIPELDFVSGEGPVIPGVVLKTGIPANLFFGSFTGEKTIDELLQRLVEEEAPFSMPLSYELFRTFGGAIYLGPGQTAEVTGSTKIRDTDLLYLGGSDPTEAVVPVDLLFGSFEGEKTVDELLQQLIGEDAPSGIPLTYDWFKTVAGPIYLGPGQTGELTGSTKVTADTNLYIPIITEVETGAESGGVLVFSRSRLSSLR
ncbi:MAG: hypothetical protein LBU21_04485 [Treponema sp.]|jgi:hypothetical protein|nr:hypothetical protein [Treponema sp.]